MKKFFNIFFVSLGVVFLVLIIAGVFFFVIDPYNLKPLFMGSNSPVTNSQSSQTDKNPNLSDEQEQALEKFGVNPAQIPSSITPAQEACFVKILGQARVDEIKAGGSPTPAEYISAKSCI